MNQEDIQKALEAIGKSGIKVAGDLVIEKHVEYEVDNVEAGGIGIQINNGESRNAMQISNNGSLLSFEEAIPEYLRTGKLLKAWNGLRKAGILDEEYRLTNGGSKAEAYFLVKCFCQDKKNNSWRPFEKFWCFTDLKHGCGTFSKESEMKISAIFRNL